MENNEMSYTCTIIGRKKKWLSGLSRVSTLWSEMIQDPYWSVKFYSDVELDSIVSSKKEHLLSSDVVILSGDSSTDESAYEKIRSVTKAPIISLSLFRNSLEDKKDIVRLKKYNDLFGGVYFVVWSHDFYFNKIFDGIRENMLLLPKPILAANEKNYQKFEDRIGVCVGHSLKTFNGRFTGRSEYDELNNTKDIVSRLSSEFTKIPFYVYGSGQVDIPGVKKVDPKNKLVSSFLPSIRIFISLQSNETFYLVPLEAQGVGTPVLYRHMPQSLSSYIGHSGLLIKDYDDISFYIRNIYNNKNRWEELSRISFENSLINSHKNRNEVMKLYIERFIEKKRK